MPELSAPTERVRESYLEALPLYRAEGRYTDLDVAALSADFAGYVARLRAECLAETPRPPEYVPVTHLWYVDGEQFLGRLSIRHQLTAWLRDYGGHIGYDVHPRHRRRGHATRMLALALPVVHGLDIDPALVTTDTDNVGSRKVIQSAGGVLEDVRGTKLRFWVPTSGEHRTVQVAGPRTAGERQRDVELPEQHR